MNSKPASRPGEGDRAASAENDPIDDSIDESLNKLLSETEAAAAAAETKLGGDGNDEITAEGLVEEEVVATPEAAAAPSEPGSEAAPSEAAPPAAPETTATDEPPAPAVEVAAAEAAAVEASPPVEEAVPRTHTPEEMASMSGPSLVEDVKEEHTDVEPAEVLAEVAAAAERDLADSQLADAHAGTPVRDDVTASLAAASARPDEITGTGGEGRGNDDVITAENLGYFAAAKAAERSAGATPSSDLPTPAFGRIPAPGEPSLSEQSRDERERALRRSRPPTPSTPLPHTREAARAVDVAVDDLNDVELEMAALDYDHNRRSPAGGMDAAARRSVIEPWGSPGPSSDVGGSRATPPPRAASSPGSGRHALPPPSATPPPSKGTTTGPTTGRNRLPTPRPSTPSPSRITGQSLPVVPGSGPLQPVRTTSAVFSKIQLPLGGLVTVVGAAFGVGLIIGAVLWRGSIEPAGEPAAHETKPPETAAPPAVAAPAPAAAPTPAPSPAAAAPVPAPPPPAPAAAAPAPEPKAATATASAPAAVPPAPPAPARPAAPAVTVRKVAASAGKGAHPKKAGPTPPAKSDGPGKGKGSNWVDPFAQ